MGCNGCGSCCSAIWLPKPFDTIRKWAKQDYEEGNFSSNTIFAYHNFTPISKTKAIELNPYLKEWDIFIEPMTGPGFYFYECRFFDRENRRCVIHNHKPNLCIDFPLYGKDTVSDAIRMYSADCGYKKQESDNVLEKEKEVASA